MRYRLNKSRLLEILREWNRFLKRKVHLIACGGTAITLMGVKPSTKDVDFMVPKDREHAYLTKQLKSMGYKLVTGSGWKRIGEDFQFDLFRGNRIHTTELMNSPLEEGGHSFLFEFSYLYIGILNDYDLIVSKLMRGSTVDFEDCLNLTEAHQTTIDMSRLIRHFYDMISYDVSQDRLKPNIDHFLRLLRKKGLYD
ncbi:MAG: DUF6036 family nucleotidyltransferase [Thermodesulfobacteriota bacterium]|nr:DUF6036 family nucleotidyltransferase [Thermodesulfobacteriota bacterium]